MSRLEKVQTVTIPSLGRLPLKEGASTFKPAGVKREEHVGETGGDTGYTETPQSAVLEVTLQSSQSINVEDLNAVAGEAITVELTSGRSYTMNGAWCAEPFEISAGEYKGQFLSGTSD